ncbi:hypothetical protein B0T25DRAFT_564984 [Lasiosphaeria hispida]|uniref:AN1-type domain-containing protein n=1 Tax=Lasiosphaeria hispida TaxID=260671 RepID=A0AAJ0MIC2_9PEZI|nr:hypothetical protein B0T25DRAFT_564984 [Lasiosphaeria hispida]
MPPRKIKCSYGDCKVAAQRISGDCAFCQGHYCSGHRLLEDHKCRNLDDVSSTISGLSLDLSVGLGLGLGASAEGREPQWWLCKKEAFEQNAMQLNRERTQVIKGVGRRTSHHQHRDTNANNSTNTNPFAMKTHEKPANPSARRPHSGVRRRRWRRRTAKVAT